MVPLTEPVPYRIDQAFPVSLKVDEELLPRKV